MTTLLVDLTITTHAIGELGAWHTTLAAGEASTKLRGSDTLTSVDRLALLATIAGLSALRRRCAVELHTTSTYLAQNAVALLPVWNTVGGKTPAFRASVRNERLWDELATVAARHDIHWHCPKALTLKAKQNGETATSEIWGRTKAAGSTTMYAGLAAPWLPTLGDYRDFTPADSADGLSCEVLTDDTVPINFDDDTFSPTTETASEAA
jgi:ribonuclease HI